MNDSTRSHTILLRPHTTEKAFARANADFGSRVYTFIVAKDATKPMIRSEVAARYGVTPVAVSVLNAPSKRVRRKGKAGVRNGFKKAVVYLKEGDAIQFA